MIHEKDNCVVAVHDIKKSEMVFEIPAAEDIKSGHKMAITDISAGENIIKYGYPIGYALRNIKKGEHIHNHNIKTNLKDILEYSYKPNLNQDFEIKNRVFKGYKRKNGEVGIRNEIWIINTVGCVNKIAEKLADEANKIFSGKTDGIFTFVHPFGCSQLGEDHNKTQLILKNMVTHPNAAAVLILSLGCENNNINEFKKILGEIDEERVKFLVTQDVSDELEEGIKIISELVDYSQNFERTDCDLSDITIGLKCGGSDGFSGITANPLVGKISDKIITHGGSAILTEVPEMFGAEEILMNRCKDKAVFDKTVNLINDFKKYFMRYGQEIYENPSPGNKAGGISTLEDKSLGCTQKAGSANVCDVLDYGGIVETKGLNLLNGPGNDLVAMTNLMAAHAQIILFTTGRGTPVGTAVPTIKISSNTNLNNKKNNWIDFNAGEILENKDPENCSDELFEFIIEVAEGKKTKNEINNYKEISIFKDGVTL